MKKLGLLCAAFFLLTAMMVPGVSFAKMTAMSDNELNDISAQAGIQIGGDTVDLSTEIEAIYYHDEDGIGGEDARGGYLTLSGVSFQGRAILDEPVKVDVGVCHDPFSNTEIEAINISLNKVVLEVDHFKIDAIKVGSGVNEGKSFGSIGISNMRTEISGNIRIWAH